MNTVIFTAIKAANPSSYVEQLLTAWWKQEHGDAITQEQISQQAAQVLLYQDSVVPLVPQEALPILDASQEKEMNLKKRCFIQEVAPLLPLQEGEELLGYTFSLFAQPYGSTPAHAITLIRQTNFSTLYIVPEGWTYQNGNVLGPSGNMPIAALAKTGGVSTFAADLAKGLLGKIGGAVGSAVINYVFPPSVPSYFDEVYKEIEKIVNKQVTQNTINELNGKMNGLVMWVKNTYTPRKESKNYSNKDLTKDLDPKVADLTINVIGVLMDQAYRETGLTVFMMAAGQHLALLQELAFVDPKVTDASQSANVSSIKQYANDYANHAIATTNSIVDKRLSYIKLMPGSTVICSGASCHSKGYYYWIDNLTGKRSKNYEEYTDSNKKQHKGNEEANADMQKYIATTKSQLISDMSDPIATAQQWQQLKTAPLPKQ